VFSSLGVEGPEDGDGGHGVAVGCRSGFIPRLRRVRDSVAA